MSLAKGSTGRGVDFTALSYNILAKSLGSNCIPWVMALRDSSLGKEVEAATGQRWEAWKDSTLSPPYKAHFHKNYASGDYHLMREFWAAPRLQSAEDIPSTLSGLRYAGEDAVSYSAESTEVTCYTLRGVILRALPDHRDLALRLVADLLAAEETIFKWATRGPRIFARICSAEVDIVALQEYDCNNALALYGGSTEARTFCDAMLDAGYNCAVLKDCGKDDGTAVFWRREAFEVATATDGKAEYEVLEASGVRLDESAVALPLTCPPPLPPGCPPQHQGSLVILDMLERWHKRHPGKDGEMAYDTEQTLLAATDRRSVGSVHLRHLATGETLWVVTAHLMTTSRDKASTNAFPGEVRAGELEFIRDKIGTMIGASTKEPPKVLFMGDFNTPVHDDRQLFRTYRMMCELTVTVPVWMTY
eukprot:gene25049-30561_t